MTRYPISDIMREVRIVLDLNPTSQELLPHKDKATLPIDTLIRSCIKTGYEWLLTNAPLDKLHQGQSFAGRSVAWDSGVVGVGSGRIALPEDFLRLVAFRMSDWHRPVHQVTRANEMAYPRQSSPFPGIKGNPERPIVTIETEAIGRVLYFHACRGGKGVHMRQALYLPRPKDLGEDLELNPDLLQALIYYTAYLVATTLGMQDFAPKALEISKTFIV